MHLMSLLLGYMPMGAYGSEGDPRFALRQTSSGVYGEMGLWRREPGASSACIARHLVGRGLISLYNAPYTMTTIPARLARTTLQSPTLEHARKRTIQAYREWYRAVSRGVQSRPSPPPLTPLPPPIA